MIDWIRELVGTHYAITTGFGEPDAHTGARHTGIDLRTPLGTPVLSRDSGTVMRVFNDPAAGGLEEEIVRPSGVHELYAHLFSADAGEGSTIVPGQVIAHTGSSGWSTGPHLHVEVRDPDGTLIDPAGYFARELIPAKAADGCPAGYHRGLFGACVRDGFVPEFKLPVPSPKGSSYVTPEVAANIAAGKTTSGGAPIDIAGAIQGAAVNTLTFGVVLVVIVVVALMGVSRLTSD